MATDPTPSRQLSDPRATRDRNALRVIGVLIALVTLALGVAIFAHTRQLGAPATDTLGVGDRLAEVGPRIGDALAVIVLWVCAVLAAVAAFLAWRGRPWRIAVHFAVAAGFALSAFAAAGALSYALL